MAGERGGEGFEDRLRAIGWMLDERGERLVALALVAGRTSMQVAANGGVQEDLELSPSELALLRCAARQRRGRGDATARQSGYQGTLRALGRVIDSRGARACQLRAQGDEFVTRLFDGDDEAAWLALRLEPTGESQA
jgi:uncharacterized protein (DUF934 family)